MNTIWHKKNSLALIYRQSSVKIPPINVQYLYDKNVHTKNGKCIILELVLNGKKPVWTDDSKICKFPFLGKHYSWLCISIERDSNLQPLGRGFVNFSYLDMMNALLIINVDTEKFRFCRNDRKTDVDSTDRSTTSNVDRRLAVCQNTFFQNEESGGKIGKYIRYLKTRLVRF